MHRASQAYMQSQVNTINRGELVVLLYDAALKFLSKAKGAMQNKDFATKGVLISKALDIINELDNSLSMQSEGEELGRNLHAIYNACTRKLLNASLQMDTELVDEVIRIFSSFRDAFAQVAATPEAQKVTEEIALNQQATLPQQRILRPATQSMTGAGGASNAKASSLYAQKVAEKESFTQTSSISATRAEQLKQAVLTKESLEQKSSPLIQGISEKEKITPETPPDLSDEPKVTNSFGGGVPNMNLYKKFSASNNFGS